MGRLVQRLTQWERVDLVHRLTQWEQVRMLTQREQVDLVRRWTQWKSGGSMGRPGQQVDPVGAGRPGL